MLSSSRVRTTGAIFLAALVATGCSTRTTARFPGAILQPTVVESVPAPTPEPVPPADPATELIAVSTLHFAAGQHERAYERMAADWEASRPSVSATQLTELIGAGVTPGRASQRPSRGKAARQTRSS